MQLSRAILLAIPLAALPLTTTRDALACGGCFTQQTESSQVTGHKMILSISKTQTTLWDQIEYSGNPSSFAWILPIKGIVDIGLSSDLLFQELDQQTRVIVSSPSVNCAPANCSSDYGGGGTAASGGGPMNEDGDVQVIAHAVVGPYETVQLKASDPAALTTWLTSHMYTVPADIAPIVDAYIADGFDFLALKLVPNQGVQAMRPVRITTPGASPILPLRMVAAGTGAVTSMTLWVMGEGRYVPANAPSFTIDPSQLVWNWDTRSSNYTSLKKAQFDATQGKGWLVEASYGNQPTSDSLVFSQFVTDSLTRALEYTPPENGYGTTGPDAQVAAKADLDALFGHILTESLWSTRLHAELTRAALATDLELTASSDQSTVSPSLYVTKTVGTEPACTASCPDGSYPVSSPSGCSTTPSSGSDSAWMSALGVAIAVAAVSLRRRHD